MKHILTAGVIALGLAAPASATAASGTETYDLLFREGTLDAIPLDRSLVYSREVDNSVKPDAAERDTGTIALDIRKDEARMADIEFRQGEKYRNLGSFPASVGNPMIMYFYETVVRDMAEAAGGSPFYIRNRVKEALVQPSEVVEGEASVDGETVETRTITLHPFRGDPNADRMMGFGDLALTVTMSDEVPGWYLSLVAEAPGDDAPVYRSAITFDALEDETQ
ncbi:hypothetical protein [Citreimonas sp.]|uniref:hypothetical protein n=1 Tax=Citreimonas sp. TaxID=3036715 RepID=UPI0035C80C1B